MATRVRSFSKVNLGLAIGPVREDGFHGLATLYQTLALHDVVTVAARRARQTLIRLTTNNPLVPTDARNTAWKMVELALGRMKVTAEVAIHIEKELPVQGGLGAGSANAAAALIGLERELGVALAGSLNAAQRLELAAGVGSDVPLFLVGGSVLGVGRGEVVSAMADLPAMACVVAVPGVGVSTPRAFADWDALVVAGEGTKTTAKAEAKYGGLSTPLRSGRDDGFKGSSEAAGLTSAAGRDRLEELSLAYASVLGSGLLTGERMEVEPGTSGIVRGLGPRPDPEKKQGGFGGESSEQGDTLNGLAEDALLALVRTGIENDFEQVVFPQYPLLREIKHELMGISSDGPALYAALSGSGSALFGLYGSVADARAAQQRVQAIGCKALLTETLPRQEYWRTMFAE